MNTDSDIWLAFARTFGMLFMVLALLLLVFYLLKRFLAARGGDSSRDFIKVLTVHHLSPKEKLVLVNVMDETILIGVTPNQISKIKVMGKPVDPSLVSKDADSGFSDLLSRKLNRSFSGSHKNEPKKNIQDVDKVQDA
ncbi:MAG: flagellar biosynthetic protein FliO [Desulfobacteraceae bacterium]|nr:flagellar biosynthetic protein FliO [Desulfobacteraceae bacterium]